MDVDTKFVSHIPTYRITKMYDFRPFGTSMIHEHQRLLVVHSCISETLTLPTALFYHPTSRYLLVFLIHCVVGHSWILGSKFLILASGHNGVHEEAARIAFRLRVGKFGIAYLYYHIAQLAGIRLHDTFLLQRSPDISIIQARTEDFEQTIHHMGDKKPILPLMLEPTLTVSILAVSITESHQLTRSYLHRLHLIYNILGFDSIRSDVLHGARPTSPGMMLRFSAP